MLAHFILLQVLHGCQWSLPKRKLHEGPQRAIISHLARYRQRSKHQVVQAAKEILQRSEPIRLRSVKVEAEKLQRSWSFKAEKLQRLDPPPRVNITRIQRLEPSPFANITKSWERLAEVGSGWWNFTKKKTVETSMAARDKIATVDSGFNLTQKTKTAIGSTVKEYGNLVKDWGAHMEDYQKKALQLRSLERVPEMAEEADFFNRRLDSLVAELQQLPKLTQFLLVVVVWKVLSVIIAVFDEILQELVGGRTLITKILMFVVSLPGLFLIGYFRSTITENVLEAPERSTPSGVVETGIFFERYRRLVENFRRLPPVFWVTTSLSSLVALQLIQSFVVWFVRYISSNHPLQIAILIALAAAQSKRISRETRKYSVSIRKFCRSVIRKRERYKFFLQTALTWPRFSM